MKDTLRGALRSMTVWFNATMGTAAVALPVLQDAAPSLADYIPANVHHHLMGVVVIGNLLLRIKTNSSLADKAQK